MANTNRFDVLIVDDEEDLRDALADNFRMDGFAVLTATDGRDALRILKDSRPDIILLDLKMPVMDGWAFREAQTREPRLAAISTYILSGEWNVHAMAAALGVAGAFAKPIAYEDLLQAMRALVGHSNSKSRVTQIRRLHEIEIDALDQISLTGKVG